MTVIKQTIVTCTGFEGLPRGEYRCMLLIGKDKYRMGIATVDKSVTVRVRDWAEWTHETNKSKGIQGR